jgi:hypothetical protein
MMNEVTHIPVEQMHDIDNEREWQRLARQCTEFAFIEEKIDQLTLPGFEQWVDSNYRLEKAPSLYGGAGHLKYVGEK